MRLDLMLLKPYIKSIAMVLLVPLIFPFVTTTLFEGLSFAVTVIAMTTAYTFSIAEKNGLNRFYYMLPVKKSSLVAGRYLAIFCIGILSILLEAAVQSAILFWVKKVSLRGVDTAGIILLCILLFCIYAGVQLPGYYKYGSIKGKIFMFIPTVGFLLFYSVAKAIGGGNPALSMNFSLDPKLLVASAALLIMLLVVLSAMASAKIVLKNKTV